MSDQVVTSTRQAIFSVTLPFSGEVQRQGTAHKGGVIPHLSVAAFSRSTGATLLASVSLLIPAAAGLLTSGIPRTYCPLPMLTIVPAFVLSVHHLENLAITLPSLLFLVWSPGLMRGQANVARRSHRLLAVLTLLSVYYFVTGWKLGVEYQGIEYTRAVCFINIVWVALLTTAFVRVRKTGPSFRSNLVLHWTLFAWLAWYAFPYLGELP